MTLRMKYYVIRFREKLNNGSNILRDEMVASFFLEDALLGFHNYRATLDKHVSAKDILSIREEGDIITGD